MKLDYINAVFELGMAITIARSVARLYRAKQVQGWSVAAVAWPTAWGFWNLFYYPRIGQQWSWLAGLAVVAANSTWLGLMFYYRGRAGNG